LGSFEKLSSVLKTEYKTSAIVNIKTGQVETPDYPKSSPDHIFVQGTLSSGALASISYFAAPTPTIDPVGVRWIISGSKGQIEVVTPPGQWQMDAPGTTLKVKVGEEQVQVLTFEKNDAEKLKDIPNIAKNTARLYDAFASSSKKGKETVPTFEEAVKTHELLDWIRKEAGY
jgi:hypothetical protein